MRPFEFHLPTRIQFGRGLLRKLGDFAAPLGKAALLVGYRDAGVLEETYVHAAAALEKVGVRVVRFAQVTPEPHAELVALGAALARDAEAAFIVGLGGGSVLDVAKAIALMARSDGDVSEYFLGRRDARPPAAALPVVAVPTTAGTGAEVTEIAILSQATADGGCRKQSLYGAAIRPTLAVIDPDLAVGSPAALTAACGADALGHAVEASANRRGNPISSLMAAEAVRLISGNLVQAVENPTDPEPREGLALAATLAGAAFNASSVTLGHALAQTLGARLGLPHALAVAAATPIALRFNLPECVEPYARLAAACGLAADGPSALAERFVEHIADLLCKVNLPTQFPRPADASDAMLDALVQETIQTSRALLTLNPRRIDVAALRQLFEATFGG